MSCGDGDDRRPPDEVVAGGHRELVRAGDGDGQQIAGPDIGGQRHIRGEHIPRLAVPSDDGDRFRSGRRIAPHQPRRIAHPYSAGRGLSLIPPSTATKVWPPVRLTDSTR